MRGRLSEVCSVEATPTRSHAANSCPQTNKTTSRELQRVLQQGKPAGPKKIKEELVDLLDQDLPPSWRGQPQATAFDEPAQQEASTEWNEEALDAAEAVYVKQLQQEALKGVASVKGGSKISKVSVPFDFWVHVCEKHDGNG